ncbi:MAG: hypothetical protein ACREIW_11950 [Chthoniobacterales bacterium]
MRDQTYWKTLLHRHGGFYECPCDESGNPLGPIVGYTERYDGVNQLVGMIYVNCAKIEEDGLSLREVSEGLLDFDIVRENEFTGFCGAPEGGKALAAVMAALSGKQNVFPDKVIEEEVNASRPIYRFKFGRHEPKKGGKYLLVEDVTNNFSTARRIIELFHDKEASIIGILAFWNRSSDVHDWFEHAGERIPMRALVQYPFMKYRQDDPRVATAIKLRNVVLDPKDAKEWNLLMRAMKPSH